MDFDLLPPEINSLRMYAGPGAGPLLAAALAWAGLAGELNSAAAGFGSVATTLTTDIWRGSAATAMAGAAAGYVAWLNRTAAHAEQTAAQAKAAVSAYQTAFAMTVPPPSIAANRSQLLMLIATNLFGQNSAAIAATETQYEQMWAQDVTAMNGYSLSSAGAATLTPFVGPTAGPAAASALAAPAAAPAAAPSVSTPGLLTYLLQIPSLTSAAASTSSSTFSGLSIPTTNHALAVNAMRDAYQGIGPFEVGVIPPAPPPVVAVRPPVSVLRGEASSIGRLSVPPSWSATVRTTSALPAPTAALPAATAAVDAVSIAEPLAAPGLFGEALLGTLAGRGVSGTAAKATRRAAPPGRRPTAGTG